MPHRNDEQLQREAIANGPADLVSTPTPPEAIEEIAYVTGENQQKAINALLEMVYNGGLIDTLIHGRAQQEAANLVRRR